MEVNIPEVLKRASYNMTENEQKRELPTAATACFICPLAVWYIDTTVRAYCTKMMRDNIWVGGNMPPKLGVKACSARDEALKAKEEGAAAAAEWEAKKASAI